MPWNNRPERRTNQIKIDKKNDITNKAEGGTMKTQDFRTRTMMIDHKNPACGRAWGIGVDVGYSGTKLFSPNRVACFPSYATPVTGSLLNLDTPDDSTIFYRDSETRKVWRVGQSAQDSISLQDPDQNSESIYDRQRYLTPMYLVVARTAMGIACSKNEYGEPGNRKVYLQTGLPNQYLKSDTEDMVRVLAGKHSFDLKIGGGGWQHFDIELDTSTIDVMAQPTGTLISVSTDNNGAQTPDYSAVTREPVVLLDPGFGTMDYFAFRGSEIVRYDTSQDFTMKRVLTDTSAKIFKQYRVEIPIPAMQKYLSQGYITQFDKATRRGYNYDFSEILEECNQNVAKEAIDYFCELFNYFLEYRYLILTGGTGEAWFRYFKEALAGIPNLTVLPGNKGTEGFFQDSDGNGSPLPFFFSNVRGYYFSLQLRLMRDKNLV